VDSFDSGDADTRSLRIGGGTHYLADFTERDSPWAHWSKDGDLIGGDSESRGPEEVREAEGDREWQGQQEKERRAEAESEAHTQGKWNTDSYAIADPISDEPLAGSEGGREYFHAQPEIASDGA
jgi:hypothetical protein